MIGDPPIAEATVGNFCMDLTEVSVSSFRQFDDSIAYERSVRARGFSADDVVRESRLCNATRGNAGNHPMNCVDWNRANACCHWRAARLPTEQEWERAARGSDGRRYPWGNAHPSRSLACYGLSSGTCRTGGFLAGASPYGVLDLAGNVWEWTASEESGYRVKRGGGWAYSLEDWLERSLNSAETRSADLGFRCVRDI